MIGFLVGAACLAGLIKMAKHHRCGHHGGGYGCGHGRWRHGGWRHGGWGYGPPWNWRRFMLRQIFERLETTPGQERVILEAADELESALRNMRGEVGRLREDLANAIAGDTFHAEALNEAFARQDQQIASVRQAITSAFSKVHQALDPRQRAILADILRYGPRRPFWRPMGPPERF